MKHLTKTQKRKVINHRNKKNLKCKNGTEIIKIFSEIFDPNYKKIKQFFYTAI